MACDPSRMYEGDIERVTRVPILPGRARDAHKGTFGRVLVIGGSVGMAGAPSLVTLAALRSGAGLATAAVPETILATVAGLCPCATTIPLGSTSAGQIAVNVSRDRLQRRGLSDASTPDALVTGPGIGPGADRYARQLWSLINDFRKAKVPTVIDADALNLSRCASRKAPDVWNQPPPGPTILTPHPGELARMHQVSTADIQADREGYAVRTVRMMTGEAGASEGTASNEGAAVVVLKGAGTVVTDGLRVYTNDTGNPGMATGGSGDVLAGVIGALVAAGLEGFDAAVLGVYLHGRAGDLAAERLGQASMIATDLIEALPAAFIEHEGRGRESS